jgi:hypothetical protein
MNGLTDFHPIFTPLEQDECQHVPRHLKDLPRYKNRTTQIQLACKYPGCTKKTSFYCPGCSNVTGTKNNSIVALCGAGNKHQYCFEKYEHTHCSPSEGAPVTIPESEGY